MDLLAQALGHHGFTVTASAALEGRSGTVYTIPLLAERDDQAFIVDAHLDGVVPQEVLDDLLKVQDDVGADGCVLAHLEPVEATDSPVALWGQDALIRVLGQAALSTATEYVAPEPDMLAAPVHDAPPVAESLSELLPPAFHEAEDGLSLLDIESLGDASEDDAEEDFLSELDALVDPSDLDSLADSDVADAPEAASAAEATMPPTDAKFALLPVQCTAKEAANLVRERLFEAGAVQMVLHPVYLFDYECDLLAEGSLRYDTIHGRLQVHGTHKHVREVDAEAVDPAGFGRPLDAVPREEKVLRIQEDRAKQLSRDYLVEAHTRLVDVEVDDDEHGYAYTEKRKVAPRPDHIRLAPKGVFYRVTWRVFGPNGHVDVDGMTGEVQEQALQTPDPDVFIMD